MDEKTEESCSDPETCGICHVHQKAKPCSECATTERSDPMFIVAEVSKNWPLEGTFLLSQGFEQVIETNHQRGYRLHSWRMSRVVLSNPGQLYSGDINETIIAVFEKVYTGRR